MSCEAEERARKERKGSGTNAGTVKIVESADERVGNGI